MSGISIANDREVIDAGRCTVVSELRVTVVIRHNISNKAVQ